MVEDENLGGEDGSGVVNVGRSNTVRSLKDLKEEEESEERERMFELADEHFYEFCKDASTSGHRFTCEKDGYSCSTRHIMRAHIAMTHSTILEQYSTATIMTSAASKGSDDVTLGLDPHPVVSRKQTFKNTDFPYSCRPEVVLSDEELALQLALEDYDRQLQRQTTSSSSPSKRARRGDSNDSLISVVTSPKAKKCEPMWDRKTFGSRSLTELAGNGRLLKRNFHPREGKKDTGVMSGQRFEERKNGEATQLAAEDRKKRRLDKLLEKTDKMVNRLSEMMENVKKAHTERENRENEVAREEGRDILNQYDSSRSNVTDLSLQPHFLTGGVLRDYQLKGVEWLCGIHYSGLNSILADEMGLGKTVQIIAFICALWERYSIPGPHLVVVPVSVLKVWEDDLSKFSPNISLYVHHGVKDERHAAFARWSKDLIFQRQQMVRLSAASPNNFKKPEHISIVITTYEIAIRDLNIFRKQGRGPYKWGYLVVDEAHRIKNNSSKLFESLRLIGPRRKVRCSEKCILPSLYNFLTLTYHCQQRFPTLAAVNRNSTTE